MGNDQAIRLRLMKRARLAIPLVVLLAGCGSVAGTAATHSIQFTGTHSIQLTGRQLAAALVPGSAFPRGYRYDSSTSFNSGNRLESGPGRYRLASVSCAVFSDNFGRSGFGETAVAGNSYETSSTTTPPNPVAHMTRPSTSSPA